MGAKVVVGYDGSESSKAALRYAANIAGSDGKVWIVTSFAPPHSWLGKPNFQQVLDEHRGNSRAILNSLVHLESDLLEDIDYSLELIGSAPAEAIDHVARTRDADLIVVGSRGLGMARAALGSVSHELLRRSDRPVTVVPPLDRAARGTDAVRIKAPA